MRVALVGVDFFDPEAPASLTVPQLVAYLRAQPELAATATVEARTFTTEARAVDIAQWVVAVRPDVVGFSVFVWGESLLRSVIRRVGALLPEATLVVGGPQTQGRVEEWMTTVPEIAAIVQGEGETALAALVRAVDTRRPLTGIANTTVRRSDGALAHGPTLPPLPFSDIPSAYLSGTLRPSSEVAFVETVRGCPYRCAYCDFGHQNRSIRVRDLDAVRAELAWLRGHGVTLLVFADPVFNFDAARAVQVLRIVRELGFEGMSAQVCAELLREDVARELAGCRAVVGVGLQSTNPEACRLMRRNLRRNRFERGIELLRHFGIAFKLQLICGLPGDTFAGFCDSLDTALAYAPAAVEAFPLQVLPGTHFHSAAEALGLVFDPAPPHVVVQTAGFPAADLARARPLAMAIHKLYGFPGLTEQVDAMCRAGGRPTTAFLALVKQALRAGEVSVAELMEPRRPLTGAKVAVLAARFARIVRGRCRARKTEQRSGGLLGSDATRPSSTGPSRHSQAGRKRKAKKVEAE